MDRVYNFSPGPSQLPLPVLEKAQKDLLVYGSAGMSVMEMSHRSKMYTDIYDQTVADLRELMAIPEEYEVVFLQGGATQFRPSGGGGGQALRRSACGGFQPGG